MQPGGLSRLHAPASRITDSRACVAACSRLKVVAAAFLKTNPAQHLHVDTVTTHDLPFALVN